MDAFIVFGFPPVRLKRFSLCVAALMAFVALSAANAAQSAVDPAGAADAKMQQRIKDNEPSPGTEASLRRWMDSWETQGRLNYDDMEPPVAQAAREQAPQTVHVFQQLGALQSLQFERADSLGRDICLGTFAHGQAEFHIGPLDTDGKVAYRSWRILP